MDNEEVKDLTGELSPAEEVAVDETVIDVAEDAVEEVEGMEEEAVSVEVTEESVEEEVPVEML